MSTAADPRDPQGDQVAYLLHLLAPPATDDTVVETCAVVRMSRSRRFLVPLASRAAAVGALAGYSALRPAHVRAARLALAGAFRVGLGTALVRGRVVVPAGEGGILAHLGRVLGEPRLAFAAGLRRSGSFYTPVLQLFRVDGTAVGYAKLGWDEVTRTQVRTEAETLTLLEASERVLVRAPALLHHGRYAGLELSVTSPMPPSARRIARRSLPPVEPLREVAQLDGPLARHTLRQSGWWHAHAAGAVELEAGGLGSVAGVLARVDAEIGDVELDLGRWHGDWVAWNMATTGADLWVWDWEYSRPHVPFGFDLLHFFFQEHFVRRRRPAIEAFARATDDAVESLARLGLDAVQRRALAVAHRLEVRVRAERAALAGAEREGRLCDPPLPEFVGV